MINIDITNNDLDTVKNYIKKRHTAILVIMFTDIVGYTKLTEEQGEEYVATLVETHNSILTKTIEENDTGKVIKYIGDSVMAIFSEPTKAVEIAQVIHEKLKGLENIEVRIGLHMGQVAIDNNLKGDILGRHVNRASRIEGLAGAGQTFMSYSVFDSAKGWLQDNPSLGWKYHGDYFLKGIDKPAEIYEVYNPESKKYKAPKNGKKKTVLPPSIFLILFLFIGAGITYGFFSYTKTEIYLFDFNIEYAMLDDDKIFLDGNAGDHKRLLLNEIKKGKHLIYYDVSPYVRYYSLIDVERGVNLIDPEFKISRTPYFEFKTSLDDGLKFTSNKDKIFSYYNENKELITQTISCNIVIDKKIEDNIIKYISSWELFIDGQPYKHGIEEFQQDIDSKEYNRGDWISYEKDNIYIVSSKQFSRLDQYEIEIMFGWY